MKSQKMLPLVTFCTTIAAIALAERCPSPCSCVGTSVVCQNSNFTDSTIIKRIAKFMPNVTDMRITGNNFSELNANLFGNCSHTKKFPGLLHLRFLDLSRNQIRTIHGKSFHCVPNLKVLILDDNEWKPDSVHVRVFTDLIKLTNLSLANAFLESTNGRHHLVRLSLMLNISDSSLEPGISQLRYLNLASNEFWNFKTVLSRALCHFKQLRVLDLSNNNLEKADIQQCMRRLEVLNLSNNRIIYMTEHLMTVLDRFPHLKRVYLGNNDYACDCHARRFHDWLNKTRVNIADRSRIRCKLGFYTTYQGIRVDSLSTSSLRCVRRRPGSIGTNVILGIIVAGLVCFFLFFSIQGRHKIKTLWLRMRSHTPMKKYRWFCDRQQYSSVNEVASF